MEKYLAAGGKVIALGPVPFCKNDWQLPNRANADIFSTVPDGVHVQRPKIWSMPIDESNEPDLWREPMPSLYYHPHRLGDGNKETVLELVRQFMKPMPVQVAYSKGYLCTMAEDNAGITVQFLAADYDVDINHELDAMRTHRSRVNLLTTITPIGTDRNVDIKADAPMQIHTPFNSTDATVTKNENGYTITLPESCSYAVCYFPKEDT